MDVISPQVNPVPSNKQTSGQVLLSGRDSSRPIYAPHCVQATGVDNGRPQSIDNNGSQISGSPHRSRVLVIHRTGHIHIKSCQGTTLEHLSIYCYIIYLYKYIYIYI